MRVHDVLRQPEQEGVGVIFGREPRCGGGLYVVNVFGSFREISLRDQIEFDFEKKRFEYLRQWFSLSKKDVAFLL